MSGFLKRIRTKTEHEKRLFAFSTSLFITLIIGVIWVVSFFSKINNDDLAEQKTRVDFVTPVSSIIYYFESFVEMFKK